MPFLVTSFDFGGSSRVYLHACTPDYSSAKKTYETVRERHDAYNREHIKEGIQHLVEMVYVRDGDVHSDTGIPICYGDGDRKLEKAELIVIQSNNGQYDRC